MDIPAQKIGLVGLLIATLISVAVIVAPVRAGTGLTATSGASSVTSNSWTNNTNAFGIADDNTYATASPAKKGFVTGDWGNYGFDSTIPVQADITKVEIIPQYKVSTTGSVATLEVQAVVNGSSCPTTALAQSTEPTTDTEFVGDVTSCRTWTRADLLDNAFGARITASRGSSNTAVTFSLDYIKVRVTYSMPDYNQSAWRLFQNIDSSDVGSALATQNTPATLTTYGSAFRARMLLHVSTAQLPGATEQFKLQYAGKGGGSCSAPTGTPNTYTDVTSGTLIAFNANATPTDNTALTANAADPTHSTDPIVDQTYVESNPISTPNTVAISSDGKWDFSLKDNGAPSSTTYCLRMVRNSGTVLETYSTYPEITTAVGTLSADIVDGSGASVPSPSTAFNSSVVPFTCTDTTGTLGISTQKIRINNTLSTTGWSMSVAPTAGNSALWSAGSLNYDFNDPTSTGCSDGGDTDIYAGQLSVNSSIATITPQSGCSNTGVTATANTKFNDGAVNSITLVNGSAAARGCYWDITGIAMDQTLPAGQTPGSYNLNLTITILAN